MKHKRLFLSFAAVVITASVYVWSSGCKLLSGSDDVSSSFESGPGTSTEETVYKTYLYATEQMANSPDTDTIFGFEISDAGTPTTITGMPEEITWNNNPMDCVATPNGAFLYAAYYLDYIAAFAIGTNGAITELPASPYSTEDSPRALDVDPSGSHLYSLNTENPATLTVLAIGSDGSLSPISGSPFTTGIAQYDGRDVDVSPDGDHVYLLDGGSSTFQIVVFDRASDGSVSNSRTTALSNAPSSMDITPDGNFLYVSHRAASNGIEGFSIDSSGDLTSTPGSPYSLLNTSGTYESTVEASSDSQYLYFAHFGRSQIEGFSIASNGSLTAVTGAPVATTLTSGAGMAVDSRGFVFTSSREAAGGINALTIGSGGVPSMAASIAASYAEDLCLARVAQ